jgi:hypothetical protein
MQTYYVHRQTCTHLFSHISVLGKALFLIYFMYVLFQCKYFDSMFSGCWAESDQSAVKMEIMDDNIDIDGTNFTCFSTNN